MKRYILALCLAASSILGVNALSVDEKIGGAMNSADWFALDSIYRTTPHDSIHPFLEVYARCLIGNRLNRPDVSIPAFQELLNTHSELLGLDNLVATAHMFGMDLSREGYNSEAAAMITAILASTRQYLDSTNIAELESAIGRYNALAAYHPYQIEFPDASEATVSFTTVPVGPAEKGSVLMHLRDSYINGTEAEITFDTGAGVNMISVEMAEKYGLIPLDSATITITGVNQRKANYAIARELKMGNMTVRDVPFTVVDLSSGNDEADQYFQSFNIVVGSDLMLQLKDVTIDFEHNLISVPTVAPEKTDDIPNLCFSTSMNLMTKGKVLAMPVLMCLDSGDAAFGSLDNSFYIANKEYVEAHGHIDNVRQAGLAGVIISDCYKVPDMPVEMGGKTVSPAELVVSIGTATSIGGYACKIGLRTMMLYSRLRFNLIDFTLTAE